MSFIALRPVALAPTKFDSLHDQDSSICQVVWTLLSHDVAQVLDDIAPQADPEAMQEPDAVDLTSAQNKQKLLYCERFVEFLTDLLSQLPTRRFIRTVLEDRAILTKCRMSALFQYSQGEDTLWLFSVLMPQSCLIPGRPPERRISGHLWGTGGG